MVGSGRPRQHPDSPSPMSLSGTKPKSSWRSIACHYQPYKPGERVLREPACRRRDESPGGPRAGVEVSAPGDSNWHNVQGFPSDVCE